MLTITSYGQRLLVPLHHHPISTLRMASTRVHAIWGYDYEHNGKSISFVAGEKFDLVEKSNTDWWLVSRMPGEKFFVPAKYLKEESTDSNASPPLQSQKIPPKPMSPKPMPKPIKNISSGSGIERLKVKPAPPTSNRRSTNIKNRFEELPDLPVIPDVKTRDKKPVGPGATSSHPLNSDDPSAKRNRPRMQLPAQNMEFPTPIDMKRSSCHEKILEVPGNMYDRLDQLYDTVQDPVPNSVAWHPQPAVRTELIQSDSSVRIKSEPGPSPPPRIPKIPEIPVVSDTQLLTTENTVRNPKNRRATVSSTHSRDFPRTNSIDGTNNIRQRVLPAIPTNINNSSRSMSLGDERDKLTSPRATTDLSSSLPGVSEQNNSFSPSPTESPPQPQPTPQQQQQNKNMFGFGSMHLEKRGNVNRFRKDMGLFRAGKWDSQYMVMENFSLYFYKDSKVARSDNSQSQLTLSLQHCTVHLVPEAKDKKFLFKVVEQEQEEVLLQAENSQSMNEWFSIIQTTISQCCESPRKISVPETADLTADSKIDDKMKDKLRKFLRQRPNIETLQKKGILHYSVFGSPLESVVEKEHSTIPDFVMKCIKEVETRGLDTIGLYRLAGNTSQVQKLRYIVDQEQLYFLDDLDKWDDINIITGALKLFLREMPEPLIPFSQYDSFVEAAYISDTKERLAFLRKSLNNFSKPKYDLFYLLCNHLERVVQFAEINKMKSSNLAIVFGPTLVRPEIDTAITVGHFTAINNTLEFVISHYQEMFKR